jgi:hypothetical protein
VHDAGPPDRLRERCPNPRVETLQGLVESVGRHPQVLDGDPVEALPQLANRLDATSSHLLDDRCHHRRRRFHVHRRPGQAVTQRGAIQRYATQVEGSHHGRQSSFAPGAAGRPRMAVTYSR